MRIFLIRHGESVANTGQNETLGLADHKVYLTERGREQALKSAQALKEYLDTRGLSLGYSRVWYSPYDRTRETMEIFDSVLNFKYNMSIREDICLTEQQFGLFDSLPKEKWPEMFPVEYSAYHKVRSQNGKFWAKPPLGESPFDVAIRMKNFFGTIQRDLNKHSISTLYIFTHGTALRVFTMQYLHKSVEWYENEHNPGNCWIRCIDGDIDRGYIYKGE